MWNPRLSDEPGRQSGQHPGKDMGSPWSIHTPTSNQVRYLPFKFQCSKRKSHCLRVFPNYCKRIPSLSINCSLGSNVLVHSYSGIQFNSVQLSWIYPLCSTQLNWTYAATCIQFSWVEGMRYIQVQLSISNFPLERFGDNFFFKIFRRPDNFSRLCDTWWLIRKSNESDILSEPIRYSYFLSNSFRYYNAIRHYCIQEYRTFKSRG